MASPELHYNPMSSPGQTYFDVEGDKDQHDLESAEYDMTLTWRGDPSQTHSDWTIAVVTDELHTTNYHIHKSVVCFGRRQSKMLARIMLNQKNKNISSGVPTTKVELNQRDADNFSILLDYIYAPSTKMSSTDSTVLTAASTFTSAASIFTTPTNDEGDASVAADADDRFITTKNSVSLRYLAKKFEVDLFMLAVNRFIQRDLNFETGPTYLSKGWEYKDERLVASAKRLCTENFEKLNVEALTELPVELFRQIVKSLESFDEDNMALSHFLSDVVCEYMERNPTALTSELLLELTNPILMPYIAAEASIGFTALVKDLESHDATQHWEGLLQLCRRCAKSVVREYGWNDFCVTAAVDEYLGHSTANKRVSRVDSLLFATSFASALEQAQDDYEDITAEQDRIEGTVEALHSTISLMEEINNRKDEYITKQEHAIEAAKKQILELKRQIIDINEQQWRKEPHPTVHFAQEPEHNQHTSQPSPPPTKEITPEEILRNLVAPSEVDGAVMASRGKKGHRKTRELRGKEEMRAQSLL